MFFASCSGYMHSSKWTMKKETCANTLTRDTKRKTKHTHTHTNINLLHAAARDADNGVRFGRRHYVPPGPAGKHSRDLGGGASNVDEARRNSACSTSKRLARIAKPQKTTKCTSITFTCCCKKCCDGS